MPKSRENNLPVPPAGVWLPVVVAGVTSVGHPLHPPPDLPAELLNRMHAALPTCWSALLWAPDLPPAGWYVDTRFADRLLLARLDPTLPGQPVWSSFTILPDNSVRELSFCPALPRLPLPRALVVDWDSSRPWRPGHTPTVGPSSRLYFIGESTPSVLDPALWGFGKRLCTQLVVREAADRLTTLTATHRQLIAQPSQPCRPAIWEDDWETADLDPRGLRARETRWCQVLGVQGTGSLGTGGQGELSAAGRATGLPPGIGTGGAPEASSSRARDQDYLDYAHGAPWMRSSSVSRQHWHARQLAAVEMDQQQPQPHQQLSMPMDDAHNACSPQPDTPAPAWAPVWSRLHDLGLDRQHRLTAWRLLHGAIWCGALRAYIGRSRQQLTLEEASVLAACPRPACQGQPETLTHLFLACPSSQRVWLWVSAVWTQLSGSPGPPLSAALLMADDQRHWQPAARPPALVDTAANRHARSSALCPRAAQEGHPNHSHLSCSQACPPDAVSHAPGLAACARQQQPGSLGRWRLLLHLAQGPAALHHLGAIPAALGSARRPVPTCSRRPVPDWGTTAHNAVDGATPHAHPNGGLGG